ncbi:hypothetical protein ABBQ32_012741 [Trebouxia sp. C0010 RCD-2024]
MRASASVWQVSAAASIISHTAPTLRESGATCDGVESTSFGLPVPTSSTPELRCCGTRSFSRVLQQEVAETPLSVTLTVADRFCRTKSL